jgi:hypothetical protein
MLSYNTELYDYHITSYIAEAVITLERLTKEKHARQNEESYTWV